MKQEKNDMTMDIDNPSQKEKKKKKNENELEKADLQHTLDIVNSWVNNCEQKTNILLTILGIALTIIGTSDFLKYFRTYIFYPIVENLTGTNYSLFSWGRFIILMLLLISVAILMASCYYLFQVISANIDYEKMYKDNPELEKTSYIFFGTISNMGYETFKENDLSYIDDLKSQIFVNSKIATAKFQNYKKGLFWLKFLLVVSIILFFAIMLIK